jgi:hypothetical protein
MLNKRLLFRLCNIGPLLKVLTVLNLVQKDIFALATIDLFFNIPLQIYPYFEYQAYEYELQIFEWICSKFIPIFANGKGPRFFR